MEASQLVGLDGLLGFDHESIHGHAKLRFVFAGYRAVNLPPKDRADEHSLQAKWLTRGEIALLPLRHAEVLKWIDARETRGVLPSRAYEWHGPPGSPRGFVGRSGSAKRDS